MRGIGQKQDACVCQPTARGFPAGDRTFECCMFLRVRSDSTLFRPSAPSLEGSHINRILKSRENGLADNLAMTPNSGHQIDGPLADTRLPRLTLSRSANVNLLEERR
jgi:hypothetical protein